MLLLFKGRNARRTLESVVWHFFYAIFIILIISYFHFDCCKLTLCHCVQVGANLPPASEYGKTIRGTYGEYTVLPDGTIGIHRYSAYTHAFAAVFSHAHMYALNIHSLIVDFFS